MRRTQTSVWAAAAFAFVASIVALSGCTAQVPTSPPATAASASSSPQLSASPSVAPILGYLSSGTAQANKPYFDSITSALIAANNSVDGKAIIDSLVTAGFDKANMQLTPDKTSINGNADSVLFSVRIGNSCLLGQHSGAEYVSSVQAALKSGNCLVGQTRAINW
ncbi:MAG: hypothetical protein ABI383_15725 [Acidobacteriaceae bacterium]